MENFLKGSGAVAIGLIIAAAFTFPFLIIGVVIGWYYIEEQLDDKK